MAVEKRSLSFPENLWAELEEVAREVEVPVSTLVTDAVAHMLRIRAGLRAMDALDAEFGPPTEEDLAEADRMLDAAGAQRTPLPPGWLLSRAPRPTADRREA